MAGFGIATNQVTIGVRGNKMTMADKKRILKVEEVGDFWRKRTIPRVRLKNKWLAQVGILPNRHVQVECPKLGILILHLVDQD